jgi:hypothetical protein
LHRSTRYSIYIFTPLLLICFFSLQSLANVSDTTPRSNSALALAFLAKQTGLQKSTHWPNVPPRLFLENLQKNLEQPLKLYAGKSTNFCAYAAISFLPLQDDPLQYVQFMIKIYTEGKAGYGKVYFEPSGAIRQAAGRLTFKGELDVRPADQLWFLLLADHFKGYLNVLDHHFNMGDENKLWAAVNYNKFNKMIRQLFNYHVEAVGSDLFRPGIRDMYEYLSEKLATGHVAMFVNNPGLYRKSHAKIRFGVPTHYIILINIEELPDESIAITYWDYGGRSRQILTPSVLKKITFGVSHIMEKKANDR